MMTETIRQQLALTPDTAPAPLAMPVPISTSQHVTIDQVVSMVDEQVIVRPMPHSAPTSHLAVPELQWGWRELRDYVCTQVEDRFGVFPRDDRKEYGIFKAFLTRYPEHAVQIARHAFEIKGGYWKGAPISVTRFCKGSDPYFGDVIKAHLDNIAAQ